MLLRPDGEVEVWWTDPEPMLGVAPKASRETHERTIPAGSTLLLYTDGLVENPRDLIDVGIARVGDVLRGNAVLPGEEICSRLLAAVTRRADDIALLMIRVG
jgi:serine phosphatase RsbU (regulator of sigma subunit)